MIPDLIRKSLAGMNPLPIYGSGEQTRTFTHLEDVADGIVCAMGADAGEGEAFNIAWREETSIAELARLCWEACGRDPEQLKLATEPSPKEVDPERRFASVEKARELLGLGGEDRRRGRRRADRRVAARDGGRGMSGKRALITGITGQDGSYLAELLLDKGYEVHGMVRRASTEKFERIEHLRDRITLHQGDLLDHRSLVDTLRASKPDEVYNLAAMSFVGVSWIQPTLTAEFTGVGVTRLLECIREVCPDVRFYQASSSEMFGKVLETPQTETTPFYPRSPYGVAKVYGHHITVNYRESYDMFLTSGILFNHESERRGLEFVTRKVTWHAAAIKLGLRDEVALGNLEAKRDWGYAKDYVEAMWLMLQHDKPDDFVIATGETNTVQRLVEVAFDQAGVPWESHVKIDDQFKRPAEVDLLVGDASKAERELGWKPATSFEQLIRLMVDADLKLLQGA